MASRARFHVPVLPVVLTGSAKKRRGDHVYRSTPRKLFAAARQNRSWPSLLISTPSFCIRPALPKWLRWLSGLGTRTYPFFETPLHPPIRPECGSLWKSTIVIASARPLPLCERYARFCRALPTPHYSSYRLAEPIVPLKPQLWRFRSRSRARPRSCGSAHVDRGGRAASRTAS